MKTIYILDYGKSMYGGWYINYMIGEQYKGVHGKTLKQCCEFLNITKKDLQGYTRYDN